MASQSGTTAEQAPQCYDDLAAQLAEEAVQLRRSTSRFTWLRGLTFLAAMALLAAALTDRESRVLGLTLGVICLAALLVVVVAQERLLRRLTICERLLSLAQAAGARWRRQWDDVPLPDTVAAPEHQALAADLDLFGRGSLFHLICRTFTESGRNRLRDWLFQEPNEQTILRRQQAIAELRDERAWRQQFELDSLAVAFGQTTPAGLARWADDPDHAPVPAGRLRLLAWSLPLVLWTSLVLAAVFAGGIWLRIGLTAVAACFLTAIWYSSMAFATLEKVTTSRGEVLQYSVLFDHVTSRQPQSSWLAEITAELSSREGGPAAELRRLGRITWLSSLRTAGVLQSILYMTCQVVLLADLHLLCSLEHWRRRNAGHVGGWFEQLGEVEAAASLAGLAFDHPDWATPAVSDEQQTLRAEAIGHPLLAEDARVANDVEVGPPGTLLLVTGSNMSGKSTLLRSIGLNTLLAQAGGPVCAARLTQPPLRLGTSVRVQDSLGDGVSFFMAELKRLKQVVDMAVEEGHPRLLYLLDEILQGTNSAERQIAVSEVLQHLLSAGAIGAISTHDLELASLPELTDSCQTVHFRETLDPSGAAQSMSFDYQLRRGVATTTNALKLLELVGLKKG